MDIYIFKVRDYSTVLVGQIEINEYKERVFYIQRGDGDKHRYDDYRIEWYKKVATINAEELT